MIDGEILITGGSGFIGRYLTRELIQRGNKITLILRPGSKVSKYIDGNAKRINCVDWSRKALISQLSGRNFSTILHLASYGVNPDHRDPHLMSKINISLPSTLVELAAEWGANMVMLGSCSEYTSAPDNSKMDELYPLEDKKLYGASKAAGSIFTCSVAEFFGVPLSILRLFNVYGPGESDYRLLPSLINNLRKGERVSLSEGLQVRDFIYIKDAIDAIIKVASLELGVNFEKQPVIWNICTGEPHRVRDFAEKVADRLKASRKLLAFGELGMRADDLPWVCGNPNKILRDIGWMPQYSLDDGIADVIRSFNKRGRRS